MLATVRLFINCSSRPIVDPCSSFQVANLTAALPVSAAKKIGNIVAVYSGISTEIKLRSGHTNSLDCLIKDYEAKISFIDYFPIDKY